MNRTCRFLAYFFCLSASLASMKASGATITWDAVQDITTDATDDVLDSSGYISVHEAYNVNGKSPYTGGTTVTLNGVLFTAGYGGVPNDSLGYNGFTSGQTGDYQNDFLKHGRYGTGVDAIPLGLGTALAISNVYQVQIWINDSRSFGNNRTTTLAAGNSVGMDHNQGSTGTLGHYVTGTFTSDAPTQVISVTSTIGGFPDNAANLINGYAVYAFAEPPPPPVVKKAYWQLDDSTGSGEFKDAHDPSTYTLKGWSGIRSSSVATNPIPKPDPGPFSVGDPTNNPYSCQDPRGNTYAPVTAFNM